MLHNNAIQAQKPMNTLARTITHCSSKLHLTAWKHLKNDPSQSSKKAKETECLANVAITLKAEPTSLCSFVVILTCLAGAAIIH